jgi:hypothetical protein
MDINSLRAYRVAGMSVFDWLASLLGAALIGYYLFHLGSALSWVAFIFAWTVLGVLVHLAIGVPTMLGYYLGLNDRPPRTPEK